jgi:hypothetical protein
MVGIAIVITIMFINLGVALRFKMMDSLKQKEQLQSQNDGMVNEIEEKQVLKRSRPKAISDAFVFFVNQTKMFEAYSGTQMKIVFAGTKENENIEDHYEETPFRNVKGLPLTINVEKFSNATDMTEVLNDIYILECHTDFKVSEILSENNMLIVKGELYGI